MKPSIPKAGGVGELTGDGVDVTGYTGSVTLTIPIPATFCRGSEPDLYLTYDSNYENGVFGRGFRLSLPSIARDTSCRAPQYDETDTFVFSHTDKLVPALDQNGQLRRSSHGVAAATAYRPLVEEDFWTIEHWEGGGLDFWRVIDDENTVYLYGQSRAAQVADPARPSHVFEWLLEAVVDRHGNAQYYYYQPEDLSGIDAAAPHERNRSEPANKYPRRICYGPPRPIEQSSALRPGSLKSLDGQWRFEIVFDYGEYQVVPTNLTPYRIPVGAHWLARPDVFSTYKSGFEIRTARLCRHILMFHRFPELNGGEPVLVHALRCHYQESPTETLLKAVEEIGFQYRTGKTYVAECLPPLEFGYSAFAPAEQSFVFLQDEQGAPLADSDGYNLVDLYGEGVPGLFYSDGRTAYYREPSLASARADAAHAIQYGANVYPATLPWRRLLPDAAHTLMDITGNGRPDWVVSAPGQSGWYEANPDRSWQEFKLFESFPTDFHGSDCHLVDVTGDGLPDCLWVDRQAVQFYPNRRELGFGPSRTTGRQEHLPFSSRSSAEALVTFADMTGGGLEHLVRITAQTVEYWPNLGYGNFGRPVLMSNSPQFDPASFRPDRVILIDTGGSGVADLIYLHTDRVSLYLNQSGNAFSRPVEIPFPEPLDQPDQVSFADVYGNGNRCLVYRQTRPVLCRLCYDFTGGRKPGLLNRVVNNHGGETLFSYRSSTYFYLLDKQQGRPWLTNLPFPVQVVERVERKDMITGSSSVGRYHYRHGYYDGVEREFRGFGLIERRDADDLPQAADASAFFTAPALTKSWYYTGATPPTATERRSGQEYYQGDAAAVLLPSETVDLGAVGSDAETLRMAQRALMGCMLREELYAEDGAPQQPHPYSVVETRFHLKLIQPGTEAHGPVFFRHAQETLTYDYERNPEDPRISHEAVLEVDEFGHARRSCQIAYGRRPAAGNEPEQGRIGATCLLEDYLHRREASILLLGFPKETRLYEVKDLSAPPEGEVFTFEQLTRLLNARANGPAVEFPAGVSAELLHWERHFYIAPGSSTAAPFGEIPDTGRPCRTETAVFTESQIREAPPALRSLIADPGGYRNRDGYWWNPGASFVYYPFGQFCGVRAIRDPFGYETSFEYDAHHLLVMTTRDALNNRVRAEELDYQRLQPRRVVDSNDNSAETDFDSLGRVFVTSHFGAENGRPVGFEPLDRYRQVTAVSCEEVIAQPERYLQNAASFFFEDDFCWMGRVDPDRYARLPLDAAARQALWDDLIARGYLNRHGALFQAFHDLPGADALGLSEIFEPDRAEIFALLRGATGRQPVHTLRLLAESYPAATPRKMQLSLTYLDGFGRVLQQKHQIEPGGALLFASGDLPENAAEIPTGTTPNRWWTSGLILRDNKGNPAQEYEPFFADTSLFIDSAALRRFGVTHTAFFDALGRVQRVQTAKGFLMKREWTAWDEKRFDENDTIKDSPYYRANHPDHPDPGSIFFDQDRRPEVWRAVEKAEIFYGAPTRYALNNLGQVIVTEEVNVSSRDKTSRMLKTRRRYDIQGRLQAGADPRLGLRGIENLQMTHGLTGDALKVNSVDSGFSWSLSNCVGALIYHENERGFILRAGYDALHRPVTLHVTGGDGASPLDHVVERIVYGDASENPLDARARAAANLNGKVVRIFDQSGVTEYDSYNLLGQPLSISRRLALAYDRTVHWPAETAARQGLLEADRLLRSVYEYDALGRETRAGDPLGNDHFYTYDAFGAVSSIQVRTPNAAQPEIYLRAVDHNARGQRSRVEYGDGTVVTHYTFDPRTFELTQARTTAANGVEMLVLRYALDPVGNISSVNKRIGSAPQNAGRSLELTSDYEYDALYQLTQATGQTDDGNRNSSLSLSEYIQRFTYDDGRNLRRIEHQTATHTAQTELVVSGTSNRALAKEFAATEQTVDALFDRGGNQLQLLPSDPLTWNYHDNLAQAVLTKNGSERVVEYYVYNSEGRRARKVTKRRLEGSVSYEDCVYLDGGEIRRMIKGEDLHTGRVTAETHMLSIDSGEERIATHLRWVKGKPSAGVPRSQTRFTLHDPLGSAVLEFDRAGNPLTFEEFFPYGDTAIFAADLTGQMDLKPYRHAGHERDATTGAYYWFRYYQPQVGRWLSADPAGAVDGLNLYAYAGGNPLGWHDPTGLVKGSKSKKIPPKKSVAGPVIQKSIAKKRKASASLVNKLTAGGKLPPRFAGARAANSERWFELTGGGQFFDLADQMINKKTRFIRGAIDFVRRKKGTTAYFPYFLDVVFGKKTHLSTNKLNVFNTEGKNYIDLATVLDTKKTDAVRAVLRYLKGRHDVKGIPSSIESDPTVNVAALRIANLIGTSEMFRSRTAIHLAYLALYKIKHGAATFRSEFGGAKSTFIGALQKGADKLRRFEAGERFEDVEQAAEFFVTDYNSRKGAGETLEALVTRKIDRHFLDVGTSASSTGSSTIVSRLRSLLARIWPSFK